MPTCKICGAELHPPRKSYCSDQCAAEGKRQHKRVDVRKQRPAPPLYYTRTCPDCGRTCRMHIKSIRCRDCQLKANKLHDIEHHMAKAAGHTRLIGEMYPCQACGKMYKLAGGNQRYCKDCAAEVTLANIRAAKRDRKRAELADPVQRDKRNAARRINWQEQSRVCVVCSASFTPQTAQRKTCSDECQVAYRKQQQHAADLKRKERVSVARKAQRDAIKQLPEDEQRRIRDEINARARANYARRKAAKSNGDT